MAYLLTAFTIYQFVFRCFHLQNSSIYFAINPYLVLLPLIFFWLGATIIVGRKVDRNLLIGFCAIVAFPSVMMRSFDGSAQFFFLYLRGLQYFWGPILIVPGLLGLFRLTGFVEVSDNTARRYVTIIAVLAGGLTLFEVVAVDVLKIPPLAFPWVGNPDDPNPHDLNPFRPWGLLSYPQPNALILADLFWLALLYQTRGVMQKTFTLIGVLLSGSGTGQIGLLALAPVVVRRFFLLAIAGILPMVFLIMWATLTNQYAASGGAIGRFDLAYLVRLGDFFFQIGRQFLGQFNVSELLFGSTVPTADSVVGLTHDWAYLDVFYSYGLAGLVGYIALNAGMLYLSLPIEVSSRKKIYFALVGLALNFHYGTLNYYVGQFLFSSLVALQLNRLYSVEKNPGMPPRLAISLTVDGGSTTTS